MSDINDTFFTAVGCMDGRVQDAVAQFGRAKFGVKFADTITEAGLVGLLQKNLSEEFLSNFKDKMNVSLEKHHSKGVIVHGHQDCAASNAAPDETQKEHIRKAADFVRNITPNAEVISVFVIKENGEWKVEVL